MELDNIIYIIATIVIFVVSLLGQKKKKAEMPATEYEEEGTYSLNDFEKILERKQEYRQTEHLVENLEEEKPEERVEPIKEQKKKSDKKAVTEEENQDGFDVKSAIIYSSILERKKFRH